MDDGKKDKLSDIVDDIKEICNNMKKEAYEIGRLLTEAKKLVVHGNFQKFIRDNFTFSYKTANNLMKVYRYCLGRPEIVTSIQISVLYKIATDQFLEDLREHLFENHHRLENISNKVIKDICRRFKNKEIGYDSHEIRNLIKFNEDRDQYAGYPPF